jgi:iron-sulfur cluster protein
VSDLLTKDPAQPVTIPPAANSGVTVADHDEPVTTFAQRYDASLRNPRLARNVTRYQQNWRVGRGKAVEEIAFEELRGQLKATKTAVLDDHERYLEQFTRAAEAVGTTVHTARTAEDANRIIHEICVAAGARQMVKSKSMVSEEVELNHYLEARDIECVETDLGEWIVQKLNQRPSHIVGPALHLGRQDVGELLNTKFRLPVSSEDIPQQVHAIRDLIRPQFFTAEVGMTGANALIAESGTVMMCTNEGNGRMASSVPPVHIVLAGIEKLIPTFEDAVTQLRLLGRSGTGQRMTVYTTFITGPTPGHEMHIVLVDNGRRRMRAMPEFREALHCIRCGACANVCPPYREVGGHVFGHIYTGAIGLVVTPFHHGIDAAAKPQSMCLSCNACETVCPVGIPLPQQILDVRKMVVRERGLPTAKRVILAGYSRRRVFDTVAKVGIRAQTPLTRGSRFVRGKRIPRLNRQTRWRSLPALANPALQHRLPAGEALPVVKAVVESAVAGKTVAVFPGCLTDRLFPEQGVAVIDVLRGLGMRVVLPPELHCCGLPANNMGDGVAAKRMARQTIESLEETGAEHIVSGSASCVAMILQDYQHLFRDEEPWRLRAERLGEKVTDFTSFLVHRAGIAPGALAGGAGKTITYHDSCQG